MNIIVIDTETGGLEPEGTALTSIGALALRLEGQRLLPLEGHERISEFETAIRPDPGLKLSDKALEVQGLTRAQVMEGEGRIPESTALALLAKWLIEAGFDGNVWPIWAHNAEFDRNHLGAAIRRSVPRSSPVVAHQLLRGLCGRDSTWACTRYEAQNAVALRCMDRPKGDGGEIKPGFTLDACCHHFEISLESRKSGHGALVDAKLCARLLAKLVAVGGRI
jgi:DNA polymerase III epsilon subunit-like protein